LTVILINNWNYGMTGGQFSPTTPTGAIGTTAPYGNPERPFDILALAKGAGAPFFARGTVYHAVQLDKLVEKAILKKGFSVVEVISNCHTLYGRLNKMGPAIKMIEWQKEHALSIQAAQNLPPEKLQDKIVTGVLWDVDAPEYCEEYDKLIARVQKNKPPEPPLTSTSDKSKEHIPI
jgi:2-oxoglutarate ferredoxin oxidoreductase subunit beta